LQDLYLNDNDLSGTIPSELGSLSNLEHIHLNDNDLSGEIPSELGSLTNLQYLRLYKNDLNGTLPSSLGSLSNLLVLGVAKNDLSGTIPSELGSLRENLQNLYLYENNLSGEIPSELGDLSNLKNLWLYSNSLSGTLLNSINALSATTRLENPPYVVDGIEDVDATSGQNFSLNVSGNFGDINGNITSYSAEGLPKGLTIDSSSGVISGTFTKSDISIVTVTASDKAGGKVSDEFYIAVSPNLNAGDYAALKALYNSTGGDSWTNTGWDFSSETPPSASVVNQWHGVTVVDSRVTVIDLNNKDLSGTIPSELGDLSNLQVLRLDNNSLTGTLPSELGNLRENLRVLHLDHNNLSGELPPELSYLKNAQDVEVDQNSLSGTLPSEYGALANVQDLDVGDNSVSGTLPSELGSLRENLQHFDVANNNLIGTMPDSIDTLSGVDKVLENPPYVKTEIDDMDAISGQNFSRDISENFGDINNNITSYSAEGLPNGLTIDSSSGEISGTSTTEGSFDVTVTVSDRAGGQAEAEFNIAVSPMLDAGDYAALKALYNTAGSWNNKAGWEYWDFSRRTLPSANVVSRWHEVAVEGSRVTEIKLGDNSLSGMLPSELGSLTNLQTLDLHNSSLSGKIPSWLGSLTTLQTLDLHNSSLSGTIPSWLGSLSNLQKLRNSLSGTLPSELSSLTTLQTLDLSVNNLSGKIPSWLGSLTTLQTLDLDSNDLSGTIPSELGDLTNWQWLDLSWNFLNGEIPDSIKDLPARNKNLENPPYVKTEIDDVNATSTKSFSLDVSGNFGDINGNIAGYSAEGLPNGLTIDSSGVISGIPTTEGNFPVTVTASDSAEGQVKAEFNIEVDVLNANDYAALKALYESIDKDDWNGKAGWDFSSETPPFASAVDQWHGVTVVGSRVTEIDLDSDNLDGTLPSELGDLSNLQFLDLEANRLSGTLPSELGDLSNLQRLDLDANSLSGTFPSELGDLSNLQTLNLEANRLSGTLPSELGDLSNLQTLNLENNSLSGTFPSELNLNNLKTYNLENPPYVETEIDDVDAILGANFSLNVSGNFGDINNNIERYSASGLPEGLIINSTKGEISGTPTKKGNSTVTVTATDQAGSQVKMNLILRYRLPI